jgi:hypothetical protein
MAAAAMAGEELGVARGGEARALNRPGRRIVVTTP